MLTGKLHSTSIALWPVVWTNAILGALRPINLACLDGWQMRLHKCEQPVGLNERQCAASMSLRAYVCVLLFASVIAQALKGLKLCRQRRPTHTHTRTHAVIEVCAFEYKWNYMNGKGIVFRFILFIYVTCRVLICVLWGRRRRGAVWRNQTTKFPFHC